MKQIIEMVHITDKNSKQEVIKKIDDLRGDYYKNKMYWQLSSAQWTDVRETIWCATHLSTVLCDY